MKNNILQKGFTLIELLLVIAIIGILSSIILGNLNNAKQKAIDAKLYVEMDSLKKAMELYYTANGAYPGQNQPGIYSDLNKLQVLVPKYIASIPQLPSTDVRYIPSPDDPNAAPYNPIGNYCGSIKAPGYLVVFFLNNSDKVLSMPQWNQWISSESSAYCIGN